MTTRPRRLAGLAVAATLAPSACGGGEADPAASTTEAATEGDTAKATGPTSSDGTVVEPAQPQTIDVAETQSNSTKAVAFTLTLHKVAVQDYYVEAEITLVNDGDDDLYAWYGGTVSSPQVYDDLGRTYAFQPQAGGEGERLQLLPGEGVDAVLIFAGRVDPEASSLTLNFSELGDSWSQISFDVPLQDAK